MRTDPCDPHESSDVLGIAGDDGVAVSGQQSDRGVDDVVAAGPSEQPAAVARGAFVQWILREADKGASKSRLTRRFTPCLCDAGGGRNDLYAIRSRRGK